MSDTSLEDGDVCMRERASSPAPRLADSTSLMRLELVSVSRPAVQDETGRQGPARDLSQQEAVRQRAMAAVVDAIGPGQTVEFECSVRRETGSEPTVSVQVTCRSHARSQEVARELAQALHSNVSAALSAGYPSLRFRLCHQAPCEHPLPKSLPYVVRALPSGLMVASTHDVGFQSGCEASPHVVLPLAATNPQPHLEETLARLLSASQTIAMRICLVGRLLSDRMAVELDQYGATLGSVSLARLAIHTAGGRTCAPTVDEVAGAQAQIRAWSRHRSAVDLRVTVHSENAIPEALARLLVAESMQGRPFELCWNEDAELATRERHDLRELLVSGASVPPVLPSPSALANAGHPQHHVGPRPVLRGDGPVLGEAWSVHGPELVRLDADGTFGHEYIVGSTGTGKSELMRRLIAEDVAAGRSLALLCPKGDLYHDVIDDLPAERLDDLVPLDFSDPNRIPGLNPLELGEGRTELERNRVVGTVVDLTEQMNRDVPESVGPMYRMYARHGLTLLMSALKDRATLPDFPRIFTDRHFLQHLLDRCDDQRTVDFWNQLAKQADGDAALKNMALYIVNKFTEFSDNAKVCEITGQARSTVDLRACMDNPRTILAVNLAKGLIGDNNTRLLGNLLLSMLSRAAASRASLAPASRIPFRIYIDEFPNFISLSSCLQEMLAESRKYGIALTLVHQSMDQLSTAMAATVLTNAPTKYFFRLGSPDARQVATYVQPHFSAQDVATLPNHHAIACLAPGGAPQPPLVVRVHPHGTRGPTCIGQRRRDRLEAARARYTRPLAAVREEIGKAQVAHLLELRISSIISNEAATAALCAQGIATLAQLARKPHDERAELLKSIADSPSKSPSHMLDCIRLRSMLRKLLEASTPGHGRRPGETRDPSVDAARQGSGMVSSPKSDDAQSSPPNQGGRQA
jgi:hypothetical protein